MWRKRTCPHKWSIIQILWSTFRIFNWVVPYISQTAAYFEKSPNQMKIEEEHLFWGTASVVLFLNWWVSTSLKIMKRNATHVIRYFASFLCSLFYKVNFTRIKYHMVCSFTNCNLVFELSLIEASANTVWYEKPEFQQILIKLFTDSLKQYEKRSYWVLHTHTPLCLSYVISHRCLLKLVAVKRNAFLPYFAQLKILFPNIKKF